jgi:hypothetical protein
MLLRVEVKMLGSKLRWARVDASDHLCLKQGLNDRNGSLRVEVKMLGEQIEREI